jgi:PAS domain S-box-containing protein
MTAAFPRLARLERWSSDRRKGQMKIRWHLFTLLLIAVIPTLLFSASTAVLVVRDERRAVQRSAHDAAGALGGAVDQELRALIARLETLAASDELDTNRLDRFARASTAVLRANPSWKTIILADVSGRRLLEVPGAAMSGLPGVGDRPTLEKVIQTGRPQISALLATPPERESLVVVGVPVSRAALKYVLLAGLDARAFQEVVRAQNTDGDWIRTIVDQTGAVIARNRDPRPHTESGEPLTGGQLMRRIEASAGGWLEGPDTESIRSAAAFRRSAAAPWTVIVSIPTSTLTIPAGRARMVVGAGGALALLGLILAFLYARRIAGPVTSLAPYAEAIAGGGAAVSPPSALIEEITRSARALADAGAAVRERDDERHEAQTALRERNEALRVAEQQRRAMLDAIAHPAWIISPETGSVIVANEAAARRYGYGRDELTGMRFRDLWQPEEVAHLESRIEGLVTGEDPGGAFRHRERDGSLIEVDLGTRPLVIAGARFVLAVAVDVTATHHIERDRVHQLTVERTARTGAEAAAAAAAKRTARDETIAVLALGVLRGLDLPSLLDDALGRLARALKVEYAEVLELVPDGSALQLRAGLGWKPGYVGRATVPAGRECAAGYAVHFGTPVIVEDLPNDDRFTVPPLYRDHGILSGASVLIGDVHRPLGVLGVHATRRCSFTADDARVLKAAADIVAHALDRQRLEDEREATVREERAARSAAEASAERYRVLTETIPQIVWTGRVDGWVDYFNERFFDYTGLTLEESEGWRWQAALHPEDLRLCLQRWNNALATGERLEVECRVRGRDDIYRWHLLRALPLRDRRTGGVKSWLGTYTDIDDQKRVEKERQRLLDAEQAARAEAQAAEQRASFLSDSSRLLSSSLDCQTTVARLVRLAVSRLGDWCAVDIVADDGPIQRLAVAHLDPAMEKLGDEILRRYPLRPDGEHGVPRVLRSGRAEFCPESPQRLWEVGAPDTDTIFDRLGSAMIVPLVARERVLGTMTFLAGKSSERYTVADLALAEELALRAALAFDNARLYTEAERRRREAQELARLAAGLTQSLEAKVLAQHIVEALLPLFGVRCAALRLLQSDGSLMAMAVAGPSGDQFEAGRALPPGGGLEGRVAMDGVPLSARDVLVEPGLLFDEDSRQRLAAMGHRAVLAVPFRADRETAGVLSISNDEPRDFPPADVALLQTFANQAAVALLNARLFADAQRGRQEAQLAHAEAESANRAKDAFLATLSHELRTPLTAMLGWARMLSAGNLDEPAAARAVQIIERNTRLQVQLIDDLLDISRIISGKLHLEMEPVDLTNVITDVVDGMRQAAEAKALHIECALDRAVGVVEGDPARLQQVISNLLSNALKFTPERGVVEIRLEAADTHVEVVVRDTGPGLDAEFLPRIFDRFRRADSSTTSPHGGLGLGLALVRHIVELHGGSVSARNREDRRGAIFVVRLPLVGAEPGDLRQPSTARDGASRPAVPSLAGTRILIVEDNDDTRDFLCATLASHQAVVTAAASADEARAAFETSAPDVLITDIKMPGKDGYELVREIRSLETQQGGGVPAIALTAHANAEERDRALAAGFDLHLAKPVDPEDLVVATARVSRKADRERRERSTARYTAGDAGA